MFEPKSGFYARALCLPYSTLVFLLRYCELVLSRTVNLVRVQVTDLDAFEYDLVAFEYDLDAFEYDSNGSAPLDR